MKVIWVVTEQYDGDVSTNVFATVAEADAHELAVLRDFYEDRIAAIGDDADEDEEIPFGEDPAAMTKDQIEEWLNENTHMRPWVTITRHTVDVTKLQDDLT